MGCKNSKTENNKETTSSYATAAKEEAERKAFPNDGKLPAKVTAFIEGTGDYMTKLMSNGHRVYLHITFKKF